MADIKEKQFDTLANAPTHQLPTQEEGTTPLGGADSQPRTMPDDGPATIGTGPSDDFGTHTTGNAGTMGQDSLTSGALGESHPDPEEQHLDTDEPSRDTSYAFAPGELKHQDDLGTAGLSGTNPAVQKEESGLQTGGADPALSTTAVAGDVPASGVGETGRDRAGLDTGLDTAGRDTGLDTAGRDTGPATAGLGGETGTNVGYGTQAGGPGFTGGEHQGGFADTQAGAGDAHPGAGKSGAGDSKMGKVMEKAGEVLHSDKLQQKGQQKREQAAGEEDVV